MNKQIKWPIWTEQYEDITSSSKRIRKVTKLDRAWRGYYRLVADGVATARYLLRALRRALEDAYD
jgi:hypothetical protein